jgi:two-component system sensor histidine kinase KdpD
MNPARRQPPPSAFVAAASPTPPPRSAARMWLVWLTVLAAATALMVVARPQLDKAHVALAFLVVVLGGSAAGGRALGVSLAIVAFVLFNFLFVPPVHTLTVANPLDWLVLAAFLVTGVVAAQLLDRAQERAVAARQRAVEVERLAALGAETLNAGRAEDALESIAEVIRSAMDVACCEILVPQGAPPELTPLARAGSRPGNSGAAADDTTAWSLAAWVAEKRQVAAERPDGTKWIGGAAGTEDRLQWPPGSTEVMTLLIPLRVRDRTVGVLRLAGATPFTLDPSREQFLSALSYYAALGVERVSLVADAERAEAFRQADTLKTAIIAGLSHDLRTPLATIKAAANALRQRGSDDALVIEEEADRLNRLVADLLDLSRLNAGVMPMRPELNAVEDLVGAAVRRVSGALEGREVLVRTPPTGPLGEATSRPLLVGRFDLVQSLRALVNLIENAAKYGPPGAPIELTVDRVGQTLRIVVADRGPGVAGAERARIFEPFYRAPGVPPDVGGAGLGLAIARRVAVEQGGDVLYAPRPGGGSLFTLTLPATDEQAPNEPPSAAG